MTATGSGFLHVPVADPARIDEASNILESRLKTVAQKK